MKSRSVSIFFEGVLNWCCNVLKLYPDFTPNKKWGSLVGDKNRNVREQWDENNCNLHVSGVKEANCKG